MFHPPPPPTPSPGSSGVSGGAVAGAVVGSVAGVALAAAGAWLLVLKRRREARRRRQSTGASVVSELQGQSAEIHEKPAIPVRPINEEPQELEAAEREMVELPTALGMLLAEKKEGERSPRQSAVVGDIDERDGEGDTRRERP